MKEMTFKENGVRALYNKENAEKFKRGKKGGTILLEGFEKPVLWKSLSRNL